MNVPTSRKRWWNKTAKKIIKQNLHKKYINEELKNKKLSNTLESKGEKLKFYLLLLCRETKNLNKKEEEQKQLKNLWTKYSNKVDLWIKKKTRLNLILKMENLKNSKR